MGVCLLDKRGGIIMTKSNSPLRVPDVGKSANPTFIWVNFCPASPSGETSWGNRLFQGRPR